jgi:hypothetical protein
VILGCFHLLILFFIGIFFKEWMTCLIDPANIQDPTSTYPRTTFHARSKTYPFLQPKLDDSLPALPNINCGDCSKKKKSYFYNLIFFSLTASHLCDTVGCIEPKHLEIESGVINRKRQCCCPGVTLMLRSQGELLPKKILQIEPCHHGVNHPEANGNYLTFSCRKIHVVIQNQVSIGFFKKLP